MWILLIVLPCLVLGPPLHPSGSSFHVTCHDLATHVGVAARLQYDVIADTPVTGGRVARAQARVKTPAVLGSSMHMKTSAVPGSPFTFSTSDSVPGMMLDTNTGLFSGTPTTPQLTLVCVSATDATAEMTQTACCSISVSAAPLLTCPGPFTADVGTAATFTWTASGGIQSGLIFHRFFGGNLLNNGNFAFACPSAGAIDFLDANVNPGAGWAVSPDAKLEVSNLFANPYGVIGTTTSGCIAELNADFVDTWFQILPLAAGTYYFQLSYATRAGGSVASMSVRVGPPGGTKRVVLTLGAMGSFTTNVLTAFGGSFTVPLGQALTEFQLFSFDASQNGVGNIVGDVFIGLGATPPAGMTVSSATGSFFTLSGVPTTPQSSTEVCIITTTLLGEASVRTPAVCCPVTINAAPVHICTGPLSLQVGVFSDTFSWNISLGTSPYTYSVASGSLPAGMTLTATGLFSGTPTETQASTSLCIRAMDSVGVTATACCDLTIEEGSLRTE
jgi:hypothetical protein